MKRFLNLIGTLAAFLLSLGYLADDVYTTVDTVDGLMIIAIEVCILVYPVVNAAKWIWRRDILPWIRKKTRKGGAPKK